MATRNLWITCQTTTNKIIGRLVRAAFGIGILMREMVTFIYNCGG